jgi:regulator of protease activity HflC (stomatin/prohibitin superfamily)
MSIEGIVITIGLFLLLILGVIKSIVVVRPQERAVVERMGKYNRTLSAGLSFIAPFIEGVRKVDMRETLIDVPAQEVITKDNVKVGVDAVIYFQVIDPFKVIYNVAMFELAAIKLAQTNLRNIMGDMTLDEALVSREKINIDLRRILDDATDRWGVRVTRVEIQKIDPPKDIVDAMSRQMKAERTKRAAILEAEGLKKAQILHAEGEKQAEVLKAEGKANAILKLADAERERKKVIAEGEATAIQRVYEAIHKGKPTKDLLTIKYLESLEKIADGKSTKIFMPLETSGMLSSVATLGEVFSEKNRIDKARKDKEKEEE